MREVIRNVRQVTCQEKTDYVRLGFLDEPEPQEFGRLQVLKKADKYCICWWIKVVLLCFSLLALVAAFIIWGMPILIDQVIIPILDWEAATFSVKALVFVLIGSMGLFPVFLLPSAPSMWLAGMTFGYSIGFLIIMAGTSIGMSLPYFIGSAFRSQIHKWLERWPQKSALIRLAGEGNWFHQFRAVALLRISPFPYIIFNYASVATNVKYSPYIIGSFAGTVPEVFVTIYSGRLLWQLVEAKYEKRLLTPVQIILETVGLFVAVIATAVITLYAKKALVSLQIEEELCSNDDAENVKENITCRGAREKELCGQEAEDQGMTKGNGANLLYESSKPNDERLSPLIGCQSMV